MVHNIKFMGITIQYSNWIIPSLCGYLNWSAGYALHATADYKTPGALNLSNANNITIQSCTFRRTAAHAIRALDDTTDCTFTRNTITDTGGGGIYLDLLKSTSTGNVINYNTIQSGGEVYTDAVGIFLVYSPYTTVQHNEISDYGYTGISFGFDLNDSDTAATNIDVSYNKIHDVMKLHDDGGGIQTSGKIPNCTIHDNYIYNMSLSSYSGGSAIQGIYLDTGSFKTVYSNVIDNTMNAFKCSFGSHDCTFRDNFYNCNFAADFDTANLITNNLYVSGSNWPSEAQKIINNAGTRGSKPTPTPIPTPTPYGYRTYGFEDQPNGDNMALTGTHSGIDFGTGNWVTCTSDWNGFGSKFAVFSQDVGNRSFKIPEGKVLKNIRISCNDACGKSYKISDGVNPDISSKVPNASPITVTTGWTKAASTITITFGHTWNTGIDDIVYGNP
jgi:parallel beta-helix repeat protein